MCNSIDYSLSGVAYDNESSVKFLRQWDISPNSRICANGHAMTLHLRDTGGRWKFGSHEYRTKFSLGKDTWLEGLKLEYV